MSNYISDGQQLEFFEIPSPCIGVCESGPKGYCKGCFRSREERLYWLKIDDATRRKINLACQRRKRAALARQRRLENESSNASADSQQLGMFETSNKNNANAKEWARLDGGIFRNEWNFCMSALNKYVAFATKSFSLPDICVRLRSLIDDPRSDAADIASLICLDPSLTAKVLRLANSSLFRFPSEVESIEKAVSIVGGEALYNLVVAETSNSAFNCFDTELIDLEKHWYESVYCGMVAKYLARHLHVRGSGRFFVMGILQNLSELVVAKCTPKRYQAYIEEQSCRLPYVKQREHFGFTFSHCSGTILAQWKLPLVIHYPVMNVNSETKQLVDIDVGILALASRITEMQQNKKCYNEVELFSKEISNSVNADMDAIANAITFAEKETVKVSQLIH